MLWQGAPGCGENDEPGDKYQHDEEEEDQNVVGHVGNRQRVVHEVVEEH